MRLLRVATTLLITVVVVVSAVREPALQALAKVTNSARIAVQFVDEQTPEQLAAFEITYGVTAVLPITDASLISFTAVDADAMLTAVAGDPAVSAASRVTPLRRQSAVSNGSNASLKLSTEGPDTFSAALVPRMTVAVGQVFPVSAIIETDGAATNSTTLDLFYDPAKFALTDAAGTALSNGSTIPNTAPYKGGSGVLFNNWEVNTSSINTTTGRATLILSTNLTPSDTEEDVFSATDAVAPTGYHAGLDRMVTLYFKALVAVATPANDNIAILPNVDTGSQPAQDEKIIRYADWASVPASTCAAGGKPCVYVHAGAGNTVAVGDTRIVPSTASTCNSGTSVCAADSVVVAGDNDIGNTLTAGIVANVGFTGAGATRVSGDPVYINNDYPAGSTASVFGTVTAGDTRLLPTSGNVCSSGTAVCAVGSLVTAGDTDISSTLKHLNNVRQTDSGGSLTDLISNNATQTAGVKITATATTVSASNSTVSASPTCLVANSPTAVTVTAKDASNNPISGATVTLAKSPSSSSAAIGASTPSTTSSSGQVTFSVTDVVAETVTFTATINGTPVTQTAAVRWDSGTAVCTSTAIPAANSRVSASPTCLVAGSATTVTVTARDAGNLPVSGATITLAKTPSSSSAVITGPAYAGGGSSTNSTGVATFSVTDTVAETVTFTATINGTPVTQTAAVRWDSGTAVCTPDSAQSRIDAAPNACVVTGASTTITVSLRNSNGVLLTNSETVTLIPSPNTSLTITPSTTVTTNTGTATFTVSSSVAQVVTFTATATGPGGTVAIATPNSTLGNRVTFATSCSGTTGSVISLSPACIVIPSSGSTTTSVVLTSSNNGSSSAFSNLSSSNSSISLSPTSGNSGSTVSVTVPSSTSSGNATITATVAGSSATTTLTLASSTCSGVNTGVLGTSTKKAQNMDELKDFGDTVQFVVSLINTGGSTLTDVRLTDALAKGFSSFTGSPAAVVSPSSGTISSTLPPLDITGITVNANSTTTVTFSEKLKDESALLNDLNIDTSADPAKDQEFWAQNVVDSVINTSGNDNKTKNDVLDVADGSYLSLGGSKTTSSPNTLTVGGTSSDLNNRSYVIVDFGNRAIVDGKNNDFFIVEGSGSDDTDSANESYAVYASQDGLTYKLVQSDLTGSQILDLSDANLNWAGTLLIVDTTTTSDADGTSPGIDIESVGVINLGAKVRNAAIVTSTAANANLTLNGDVVIDITSSFANHIVATDFIDTDISATRDPLFQDEWWLANNGQSFFIGLAHFIVTATGLDQIFTTFHATAGADIRWAQARALNACGGAMCTGSGVTVAVVDTGIDATHPDLQGQVAPASLSFDPSQPSIDDADGHGTFIAGLIAARADNGAGIVGVAPQSQILAVKNELTTDSLSRSIRYAAEHGAAVINLSVGGSSPDAVERAAIEYATQAPFNAIVVASAGNYAFEGNPILFPASFPHVISVASIDPDGLQSLFSEVNSFVDVAAPGGLVTSLMARSAAAADDCRTHESSYNMGSSARLVYVGPHDCIFGDGTADGALFTNESGTSFSAPMVAGAAALAKQKWPTLTSDQFEQLVRATADDDASGDGYDPVYGAGTLNVARLLAFNFPPEIPSGSAAFTHAVVTTSGTDSTQLLAKVNNMEGPADITTVTADLSGVGLGASVTMAATGGSVYSSPVLTIPSTLTPNQYPVTVTARDTAGGQATAVVTLQVSAVGGRLPVGGSPSAFAPAGLDVAVAITRPSTKKGRTTQKKSLPISGTIGADVAFVDVNGDAAEIDATAHTWGALVNLKDGKNRVVVKSYDVTRARSDEDSLTITKDAAGLVSAAGRPSGLATALEKLRMKGVVMSADRPNASVTRAEFAKMLVLTFGRTGQLGTLPADVPASHSLAKFITTVEKLGWASGKDGRFYPDQPISRLEAARMLLKAAGWKATSEEFFKDLNGAENRIVTTLRTHGVVAGVNGRFEPFRSLTRSEAATILIAASSR